MAEFLLLLRTSGIKALVDVRRFPTSGRYPHFARDALARSLRRSGIRYLHLGEELGGFRTGGFDAYMATRGFAAGLKALEFTARRSPTAIMCAERLPWRCHRRFIGAAMSLRGWDVVHVIDPGHTWSPGDPTSPELPLGEIPSIE